MSNGARILTSDHRIALKVHILFPSQAIPLAWVMPCRSVRNEILRRATEEAWTELLLSTSRESLRHTDIKIDGPYASFWSSKTPAPAIKNRGIFFRKSADLKVFRVESTTVSANIWINIMTSQPLMKCFWDQYRQICRLTDENSRSSPLSLQLLCGLIFLCRIIGMKFVSSNRWYAVPLPTLFELISMVCNSRA